MKHAILLVSPELFIEAMKGKGWPRTFAVVDHALPDDARFVRAEYNQDRHCLALVLESDAFAEVRDGDVPPILESPICEVRR